MNPNFYSLTVSHVESLIDDQAKSVFFTVPDHLQETFLWYPGQHLTVKFNIEGANNNEEARRSYSISSSPFSKDGLRITVKRVKGGLVSNHINDHIKAGDTIEVMPPFGGFKLDASQNARRTHYFFGAGSGITPLFAMLHSILLAEPHSDVHLIYGNKNDKSTIFKEALQTLLSQYPNRMTVSHVFSSPAWLSSFNYWRQGIVDEKAIIDMIKENPPYAQDTQYYVCGPGGMNTAVKQSLMSIDVPQNRIHMESYGGKVEQDDSVSGQAAQITVTLNGQQQTVAMAADQTVLSAVTAAGLNPPFSCQSGVCGACKAQLINGKVHMKARMALEDKDIKSGAILTCQSVACSDQLELIYD